MLKTIAIVIALAITGVLIYAATKPDRFAVIRTTTIKAPPDKIFALINDLQQWRAWSPYETKDPAMKRSFGAVTAGKGASYAWEGNKEVGQGNVEISGTSPPALVTLQLHFIKPFEGHNQVDFRIEPQGEITRVSWEMRGPARYLAKLMGLFFDIDKMIGTDFESGLAKLKGIAEK